MKTLLLPLLLLLLLLSEAAGGVIGGTCYEDNGRNNGRNRILAQKINVPIPNLTPTKCREECFSLDFTYAGVELRDCFCGNIHPPQSRLKPSRECNRPCEGDGSQICGGFDRINIYPTGGLCYEDNGRNNGRNRILGQKINVPNLTPTKCREECRNLGYKYAGVEIRDCFCGNDHPPRSRRVESGECDRPCGGDTSQKCGGFDRINIYPTGGLCYEDNVNRILENQINVPNLTPAKCRDACRGYTFAGVEFGEQCFCGNVPPLPPMLKPSSECNMPCSGDSSQICGGFARINIYTTDSPDFDPQCKAGFRKFEGERNCCDSDFIQARCCHRPFEHERIFCS